jgi:hypothetical protein
MRMRFRARDTGFDADDYSIVCGVNGGDADGNRIMFSGAGRAADR